MASISGIIFYILIFLSVYVQVFFLITFIENRKKIAIRNGRIYLKSYPAVTIIVPVFNEEKTVYKSVRSVLNLNYPKDKIKIFLVDDGSTDDTWNIISRFSNYPNVKIFHKENGGKHTALNLGLENTDTNFFGCLDADSIVDKDALVRIMSYFEKDKSSMAVTPSVIVNDPKNIIQKVQKAEYNMGVFLRKMLSFLGAIHVTPGPFTIFKKKVFNDLGFYRHAHNTEDMEIAFRMQKNRYKIEYCNDAYVYTNTPSTVKKLYRQRLRWVYGFINNTLDYKSLLLKYKYGNFSTFTIPAGIISIITIGYFFSRSVYSLGVFIQSKIIQYNTIGFYIPKVSTIDPFFANIQSLTLVTVFLLFLVIFSMVFGQKMVDNKLRLSLNMFYFLLIYSVIAPFWVVKAIYNTLMSRTPTWR